MGGAISGRTKDEPKDAPFPGNRNAGAQRRAPGPVNAAAAAPSSDRSAPEAGCVSPPAANPLVPRRPSGPTEVAVPSRRVSDITLAPEDRAPSIASLGIRRRGRVSPRGELPPDALVRAPSGGPGDSPATPALMMLPPLDIAAEEAWPLGTPLCGSGEDLETSFIGAKPVVPYRGFQQVPSAVSAHNSPRRVPGSSQVSFYSCSFVVSGVSSQINSSRSHRPDHGLEWSMCSESFSIGDDPAASPASPLAFPSEEVPSIAGLHRMADEGAIARVRLGVAPPPPPPLQSAASSSFPGTSARSDCGATMSSGRTEPWSATGLRAVPLIAADALMRQQKARRRSGAMPRTTDGWRQDWERVDEDDDVFFASDEDASSMLEESGIEKSGDAPAT